MHRLRRKLQVERLGAYGIHAALTNTFAGLLATAEGKYLIASFRTTYPKAAVKDEKALDLVLWQIR